MADLPHTASLTVLVGPLKGRRHDFEDVVEEVLIGSDPDCQLSLDLTTVSPIHARVWLEAGGATVRDTHSQAGVFVNDDRVNDQASLRDGDFLWLGAPGGEGSVLLQFRGPAPQAVEATPSGAAAAEPTPPEETVWVIEEASQDGIQKAPAEAVAAPVSTEFATENPGEWFLEEPAEPAVPPVEEPLAGLSEDASGGQEFFFEDVAPSQPESDTTGSAFDEFLLDEGLEAKPASQDEPVFETPIEEAGFLVEEPQLASPPAPPPVPEPHSLDLKEAPPPTAAAQPPARQVPAAAVSPLPPTPVPSPRTPPPHAEPPSTPAVHHPAAGGRPAIPPTSRSTPRPKGSLAPTPSAQRKQGAWIGRLALLVGVPIAILGGLVFAAWWWFVLGAPHIDAADPREVRPGETLTLTGKNFASDPAGNRVRFKGDKEGRVIQASPTRLQVEVPEVEATPGQEVRLPLVVRVGRRESAPYELTLTTAPRIHGLSPSVAMPEEEITLAGGGWGFGVKVRFGSVEAQVVELKPTALRVRVPALPDPVGTQVPVVVRMGGVDSNPAPFAIGRLPLLLGTEPKEAGPGDLVVIRGRGFHLRASANQLRIGGAPALVLQASDSEIKAVVPRGAEGADALVELRVPASPNLGQTTMTLRGLPDPMGFQFVAEPFSDGAGHDHASLNTGLGPAFVLSASEGRSAGERAVEAQNRLNAAAAALRAGVAPDITVRLEGRPAVVVGGTGSPLLEVSDEDAAGYNEEWTAARGKGGPATPARLALWWGAVTRDLALALLRGERPKHAAGLAPEGRALADLFDAVKKGSKAGLTREAMARVKLPLREAARAAVLRVPASVLPPVAPPSPGGAPVTFPPAKVEAFRLEGTWSGVEHEAGETRYVTVTFTRSGGSLTYERALSLTVPLLSADQPQRGTVRYSLSSATRTRHYLGKWDNQKIRGRICSDADCKTSLGSFELEHSR